MTTTIITLPIDALIDRLDHGKRWITGWGDWRSPEGATCLHGAIRFCQSVPGDAPIIERVGARFGFGIADNDDASGWNEIETMIREHAEITDEMLAKVYGPQWAAVIALVRRAAILTDPEWRALADAAAAAYAAAYAAAAADAYAAADSAAYAAAYAAAAAAAYAAAAADAYAAAYAAADSDAYAYAAAAVAADAAVAAVSLCGFAARAVATRHLIGTRGYTQAHYDCLVSAWAKVIGPAHPDDAPVVQ